MDIDDTSDSNVQGQPAEDVILASGPSLPTPAPTRRPGTGRRSIIRGLARQWWRILLVWLVVTTPLVYLIYLMVEPTYEATSLLRAEPDVPGHLRPRAAAHHQSGRRQALPPDPGPVDRQRQRAGRGPRQARRSATCR